MDIQYTKNGIIIKETDGKEQFVFTAQLQKLRDTQAKQLLRIQAILAQFDNYLKSVQNIK